MTLFSRPLFPALLGLCLMGVFVATPATGARAAMAETVSPSPIAFHRGGTGTIFTPAVSVEAMPDPVATALLSIAAMLLLAAQRLRPRRGDPPV